MHVKKKRTASMKTNRLSLWPARKMTKLVSQDEQVNVSVSITLLSAVDACTREDRSKAKGAHAASLD